MKIRWTSPALADLRDAVAYIARDNPAAARAVASRIWEAVRRLREQPGIGRPGRVPDTREYIVPGTPYIAAYRVEDETVIVLRVLHGARRWPERL